MNDVLKFQKDWGEFERTVWPGLEVVLTKLLSRAPRTGEAEFDALMTRLVTESCKQGAFAGFLAGRKRREA